MPAKITKMFGIRPVSKRLIIICENPVTYCVVYVLNRFYVERNNYLCIHLIY